MAGPLEQFAIKPVMPLEIAGIDASITNSALWMIGIVVFFCGFIYFAMSSRAMVPTRLQSVAEVLYSFVANMVRDTVGMEGRPYFPFIFSLFAFILVANLVGMLPYAFTVTSHITVTMAFAAFIFFATIVIALARHGLGFFSMFWPSGIPILIMPLIVPIEIISFLSRPITLSVRLFANMTAGHILLKVFGGFMISLLATGSLWAILTLPVLGMAVAMTALELLVAVLQAYVFALLTCIYLNDAVHLNH
ncbi:MAG: F0F1 ATP synthase subunit A [Alphaproteobacteria bacterium]|nr:MAG: F0F1 ATP synthase subunit A [Alphaproteobacteria bacterium]